MKAEFAEKLLLGPLLGEAARSDDESLLDDTTEEKLLDEEPGHDRLAGAGVVGEKEADAGQRQQVAVDGFHLVRERVDDAGADGEKGVELMGDTNAFGLGTEKEGSG